MSASMEIRYRVDHGAFDFDVELGVPLEGVTGVYGVSGAGKTTLLRCIAGLEPGARGFLKVGDEIWEDSERGIALLPHQREIAYVFQEPRLFAHLNVARNLAYGAERSRRGADGATRAQIVELFGLQGLLERSIDRLSGGEAQRVAIARALLRGPRFLLMDEPLASLDVQRKDEVLPFLDRLHAELSIPVVYVSHDLDEMCRLCDRLIVLAAGRVLGSGGLQAVLAQLDPPIIPGAEASAVIEGHVVDHDPEDDITRLRFSGGEFFVTGRWGARGQTVRLRIKANDVSLCRQKPTHSSILNVLHVTVDDVRELPGEKQGRTVLIRLRAGTDYLLARITRRSFGAMQLTVGDEIYAQVKSASIRNRPNR